MGAVAAMKFYSLKEKKKWEKESSSDILRQIQITSLVLDSPFYSLSELSLEIARTRIKIP